MERHRLIRVFLLLVLAPFGAFATGAAIEGAGERYRFEPGDTPLYEAPLERCPVGEFLPELKIARGSYECARFADRMWIRPLEHGTTLYLVLPEPLPDEFSLEFRVHSFEAGGPLLRFALHPLEIATRLQRGDAYAAGDQQLAGGVIESAHPSLFGAKDAAAGSLDGRWDFQHPIAPGRDHRIAVQVRRGQVRFFVDGERVGHKPFAPEKPPQVLTLYFRRVFEAPEPFAEAPVLLGELRLATYSSGETAPVAERDLIRDLEAVETPEGLKVVLAEAVLFDFGQWALKPEARATLEKLAKLARQRGGQVRVEGHTDDVGNEAFNQVLSELRAHVVALELARLGIEAERLEARGFGESRPIAPNDSDANRARNRRVEVILARP
ncbi:MAG: hypothetical protein KatS3mg124_1106 [Porticoccaceae bacterium]|nr:MAG: hypothetical protein KatS3mg124_1106 [Porticoccaceae bacterium]